MTNTGCPVALKTTEPLPPRMQSLPVDERGYVVPWFVAWQDGKPEFRAMDPLKFVRAIKEKLCWVCGQRLGVNVCFVAGPMCGINRTSSEPPCHVECARWSARNCPFLNNPRMVRREDELTDQFAENVAGFGIKRNPGVTMLWITRVFEIFKPGDGGYLIQMGEPESVEWFACGKVATREQVMESIEAGLPHLESVAMLEEGGLAHLGRCRERFAKWLPKELMPFTLKLMSTVAGVAHDDANSYVVSYDADYHLPSGEYDGGMLATTTDPEQAMQFPDAGSAFAMWKAGPSCPCHKLRADGQPNRPLTAFNVLVEQVGVYADAK